VTHLFPNTIVSTFPELTLVSLIDPLTIDNSLVTTFMLTTAAPSPDGADFAPDGLALAARGAVEDTKMSLAVQSGFRAGANDTIVFGRNESAIGHFHRNLDNMLGSDGGEIPTATAVRIKP
jgi:hypothetical protein